MPHRCSTRLGAIAVSVVVASFPHASALARERPEELAPRRPPEPGILSARVGYDFTSGRYGLGDRTDYASLPITIALVRGVWSGEATVTYARAEGPASAVIGGPSGSSGASEASGMGDAYVSVTRYYILQQSTAGMNLHLRGTAKLAVGENDPSLSTGENDFTIATEITRGDGDWYASATFGYTFMGDARSLQLTDYPFLRVSARWAVSDALGVGPSVYVAEPVTAGGDEHRSATLGLDYSRGRWIWSAYALAGFTDGSPDFGGGVSIGVRLGRW